MLALGKLEPGFAAPAHWQAASASASSVTGDVTLSDSSIIFGNGAALPVAKIGTLARFDLAETGDATLYRVTSPADPMLLNGKLLCGNTAQPAPATYVVVWHTNPDADRMWMAVFSGKLPPRLEYDADSCGIYNYDATHQQSPALAVAAMSTDTLSTLVLRGDADALRELRQRGGKGDALARYELGTMYWHNTAASPKNLAEAAKWFGCPQPADDGAGMCKEITTSDLPGGVSRLLKAMRCDSEDDAGSIYTLGGSNTADYKVCCHDPAHFECPAVLIGKVGSDWKDITSEGGVSGDFCSSIMVLASRHNGFNDICLPDHGSAVTPAVAGKSLPPAVLHFSNGRYHEVPNRIGDTPP
jgi:hypothetical protein